MAFFSILILGLSYYFSQSVILIALASGAMFFSVGFIYPMSMGKGLSLFRHIAGTASAMMYLITMALISLTAFLASFIEIHSAIVLMQLYAVLLFIGVVVYWLMLGSEL